MTVDEDEEDEEEDNTIMITRIISQQLAALGIKPLSDLSEEAQQLKHRRWEVELSQGRRRKTKKDNASC